MGDSYTSLLVHIVFSTKNRTKDLTRERRNERYRYLAALANEKNCKALAIGGAPGHVHLLARVPPILAVSDLVRFIKSNSPRWFRERFLRSFSSQAGYGAFSVRQSEASEVCSYIEGQEEHHKRSPFENEFVPLLKRSGIAFENARLWEVSA